MGQPPVDEENHQVIMEMELLTASLQHLTVSLQHFSIDFLIVLCCPNLGTYLSIILELSIIFKRKISN